MGLSKAFITIVSSVVITNYLLSINEKYKNHTMYKHIYPYLKNKSNLMIAVITAILIII